MTKKEVIKKIREDDSLCENLDALIHEHHSQRASEINNGGIEAQLTWLEQEVGDDAEEVFKQLKP